MTELSPDIQGLLDESYESDLTEEESKKLLSMCGHGIGPNFSPAAQAVVTAIEKFDWESGHFTSEDIWMLSREVTAAALRAAADQVVPESCFESDDAIRDALLAIAAELDG